MPEITVAAVQMHPQPGKAEDNLIALGRLIDKIGTEQKVLLIVF